jgi:A/G-specific adenine glycosylase
MRTEEQVLIAMFEALIPWYEAHKRELPWRQDKEPYHVWRYAAGRHRVFYR